MSEELLSCQELVELVTDYFDDQMTLPERMRFEEHLAVCGPCRTYLHQMRETIKLTGALREESIPDDAKDVLLRTFREFKR
jgi:predicted anti-sigma-YlaC factor YlaD